jgi:hypothetical protein
MSTLRTHKYFHPRPNIWLSEAGHFDAICEDVYWVDQVIEDTQEVDSLMLRETHEHSKVGKTVHCAIPRVHAAEFNSSQGLHWQHTKA